MPTLFRVPAAECQEMSRLQLKSRRCGSVGICGQADKLAQLCGCRRCLSGICSFYVVGVLSAIAFAILDFGFKGRKKIRINFLFLELLVFGFRHPFRHNQPNQHNQPISSIGLYPASIARIISPAFSAWSAMDPMISARRIM